MSKLINKLLSEGSTGPATMTVGNLIAALSQHPKNSPVYFSHSSGDYWKTQIAAAINDVQPMKVEWSDYHGKMTVANDDNPEGDENTEAGEVAIVIM